MHLTNKQQKKYGPIKFAKLLHAVTLPGYLAKIFDQLKDISEYTDEIDAAFLNTVILIVFLKNL